MQYVLVFIIGFVLGTLVISYGVKNADEEMQDKLKMIWARKLLG